MQSILFVVLLIIVALIWDKNIFLLLDIIKYSLRGTVPITALMYFLHLGENSGELWSTKTIFIINLMQIVLWYLVEGKWDRVSDKEFYITSSERKNIKGLFISVPVALYAYFISEIISKIVEAVI